MSPSKPFVVQKHSVAGMGGIRKRRRRPADRTMPKQSGHGGSKDRSHAPPADAFDSPHPCLGAEVFINLEAVRPGSRGMARGGHGRFTGLEPVEWVPAGGVGRGRVESVFPGAMAEGPVESV